MKKVINIIDKTVILDNVNSNKIYGILRDRVVYKAQKGQGSWRFVSMKDSISGWDTRKTLVELISSEVVGDVYEFESTKEFCEWVLSKV